MPVHPDIRRATADDIVALLPLIRDYWAFEGIDGFDEAHLTEVLGDLLDEPSLGCAWVVDVGGRAVGYLVAVYVYSLEHGGLTAEIDELYIRPDYRAAGLGRQMLRKAEREFEAAGCRNVSLQLGRTNDAARAFYRRHGYRERDAYELLDKMLK